MSKTILKTAALVGTAFVLVACSGGGKAKFVENCSGSIGAELGIGDKAKDACGCMHEKLDEELNGKQMKLATEMIGISDNAKISEMVKDNKDAALVSEKIEGVAKSCMTSLL